MGRRRRSEAAGRRKNFLPTRACPRPGIGDEKSIFGEDGVTHARVFAFLFLVMVLCFAWGNRRAETSAPPGTSSQCVSNTDELAH